MPSQLQKGTTFVPGGSYDQNDFNNLVDSGIILPGAITEQPDTAPTSTDSFLFFDSGTSTLAKCTQAELVASIPSGGANGTFCLRKLGSTTGMAAPGDDSRFPSVVSGIRNGNGIGSADTVATPDDIAFDAFTLASAGANLPINWALSNVFYASLTGTASFIHTLSAAPTGRQITVVIKLNGFTCTLPAPTLGALQTVGTGTVGYQQTYTHTPGGITAFRVNF